MRWLVFIPLLLVSGCMETLYDVQHTDARRVETYDIPAEAMADCLRRGIEHTAWQVGQPDVHSSVDHDTSQWHIFMVASKVVLFDLTIRPVSPKTTQVTYRRGDHGHETETQTWLIIERCAQQVPAPPASDAEAPPQSAAPPAASSTAS